MERIEMEKKLVLPPEMLEGTKIGTLRGMLVYLDGEVGDKVIAINVYLRNPHGYRGGVPWGIHKKIAQLDLSKKIFKNAYHVDFMQIDHQYQGHGIAPMLYRYIMKKLGIIIQAGTLQSPGGRKLWAQLAKTTGVSIYAAYRRSQELIQIEIDKEDEELNHESIKMYDGPRSVYTFAMAS